MDLVSWSLNAIDQLFSTMKQARGEPACPSGTSAAGYAMDSYAKWKMVCLSPLSMEDVEDLYLFGFMMAGFLLFGLGGILIHRKIVRMAVLLKSVQTAMYEGLGRAAITQTNSMGELGRRLEARIERLENILVKMAARLERGPRIRNIESPMETPDEL